ncbi:MAG: hypothetical protein ACO3PN_05990 [Chthoniobacterales bacterium]
MKSLLTASLLPSAVGETTLQHLRCEYLTDPLGIDVSQPRPIKISIEPAPAPHPASITFVLLAGKRGAQLAHGG